MMLIRIYWIVVVLFPVSEIALAIWKRSSPKSSQVQDCGSLRLLWLAVVLGLAAANAALWVPFGRLHVFPTALRIAALVLALVGLAVRWTAILTLGRLFTVNVAVQTGHALVQTGLYRFVRHPSYAGLLLAFLGLGLFLANWLSLVLLMVPITLAVMKRVMREEKVLLAALGAPYADYCSRTKRLIPGVL